MSAGSGRFYVENPVTGLRDSHPHECTEFGAPPGSCEAGGLPYDATDGELQGALQGIYPESVVEVSGGPVATGTGTVFGPVSSTGRLTLGSVTVEEVAVGPPTEFPSKFVVGQRIEGAGIPAATTVVAIEGETLTLSNPATAEGSGVELEGLASATVTGVTGVTGSFVVGEELSGRGIAVGTRITAVDAAAHTLTLSQAPTSAGAAGARVGVLAPYAVRFPGQAVEPVVVGTGEIFRCIVFKLCPLEGGKAEVTVREVSKGMADGKLLVTAVNVGDADAHGVVLSDVLPKGLRATAIEAFKEEGAEEGKTASAQRVVPLTCTILAVACSMGESEKIAPFRQVEMLVSVVAEPDAVSGELNEASVTGGGVVGGSVSPVGVSVSRPVPVGGAIPFGIEDDELGFEEAGGSVASQAGSHPFQVTSVVTFNQTREPASPPALAKDVPVQLPPGVIGNPTPFPQCPDAAFLTSFNAVDQCQPDTALGVASVRIYDPPDFGPAPATLTVPIFNLTPNVGEPARFGIDVENVPAFFDTSVRTGTDYGVTVTAANIPETITFLGATVTFWGVPGDPRHDGQRGWSCIYDGHYIALEESLPPCTPLRETQPYKPFLSLPTSCTGPLETWAEADSWKEPLVRVRQDALLAPAGMVACNHLPSSPSLEVAPDGSAGSTPTGLAFRIRVPQRAALDPTGLAESMVHDVSVTLPAGVQLSPGAADGLQACTLAEIGFKDTNPISGVQEFGPDQASCPEASKLATVTVHTPLLPEPLEGAVYLASPQNFQGPLENPYGSLIAMYMVVEDPTAGILVKLPLKAEANHTTGQITATQELPQLPFEEAELHFFGTARAPLTTPATCGVYTTTATLTPWSGNPPTTATSSFEVKTGPNGTGLAGCASPAPFTPGFTGGVTNLQAGAFTPFTTTITRPDEDQPLGGVELRMPPGFSADLTHVKLCPETQANAGTCGPESLIGETIVSAGLGGDPFTVTGGKVYFTTGYGGANFGLSIVNPAQAGPFVLEEGRPVVVRAGIYINPSTAAVTVKTDPLPTILDGIPLQIQHANVTLTRENFAFNPTSCNPMSITAVITSHENKAAQTIASPFQVTNCASLKFAPKLTASTQANASKKNGASLHVKLTYPPGAGYANIAKVKVDLPVQLPTEQRTLTKACLAKTFEANPADCPKYSVVGHAKAITPIIPVPLEGPAYFVSYGNEKFPNLIIALHGYGININLTGTTFISKQGITSSTFKTVPDQPITSFELTLPQGPYSALAANLPHNKQNFCHTKLNMPTAYVAQNGVEQHTNTPITITGCPKAHKTSKHTKHKK